MHKKLATTIILLIGVMVIGGCSRDAISNSIISIEGYKNLKVEDAMNDEAIWQALLEKCEVEEYPKEELENRMHELETQYSYTAYYQGKTASELIEDIHDITLEELAKQQLTKEYAIELIAEKENLNLSQDEYYQILEKEALGEGYESLEEYESMFGQQELYEKYLQERILDFLRNYIQ